MSNSNTTELSATDLKFFAMLTKLEAFLRENEVEIDANGESDVSFGYPVLVVNGERYQFFHYRDENKQLCLSPENNIMLSIAYERSRGRR